eukprot:g29969.t1
MSFLDDILSETKAKKRKVEAVVKDETGARVFKTRKQIKEEEEMMKLEKLKRRQANEEDEDVLADIAAQIAEAESEGTSAELDLTQVNTEAAERKQSTTEHDWMPPQQVMAKLRAFQQPITLFGETDLDRLERLRKIEEELEEKHTDAEGLQNVFQQILATDVESEINAATVAETADETEEIKKRQERQQTKTEKYKEKPKDSFKDTESYVSNWIKRMLHEWELELSERPKEERESYQGKHASATQKQTRQYMRPLLKQCKTKTVPADVLKHFEIIVDKCHKRQYKQAGERYMTLAIGNAPWPMGVTMVGIHERAGRSRIFSSQIAHALNDETQRKYIQGLKRIMTFAQKKYPAPPSLCVQ